MTAGNHLSLNGYLAANRAFLDKRPEINISIVNAFLAVALWGYRDRAAEALSIKAVAKRAAIPYTSFSRHLRYLGALERPGVPGMGLVRTFYAADQRSKAVALTPEGEALRDRILSAMGRAGAGHTP